MSLTWITPDGLAWPLDGSLGVTVVNEAEGIFNVPVDLLIDQRVGADGGVLLGQRRPPRRVVLQFMLVDDVDNVGVLWAQFISTLAAGGTLRYQGPTGGAYQELRDITLESPDRSLTGADLAYRGDDVFAVSFLALDPWWYGQAVQESFVFAAPTGWDDPIPWDSAIPWNGGAAAQVSVQGHGPANPLWTITGAMTEVIVSNGVQQWTWVHDLASGDFGTVDHRPGSKSPRLGSALNGVAESSFGLWSLLSNDSTLEWGLDPGVNDLIISVAGTDGSSALQLWYEPRYLTPVGGSVPVSPGLLVPDESMSGMVEDPPGSGLYYWPGA